MNLFMCEGPNPRTEIFSEQAKLDTVAFLRLLFIHHHAVIIISHRYRLWHIFYGASGFHLWGLQDIYQHEINVISTASYGLLN